MPDINSQAARKPGASFATYIIRQHNFDADANDDLFYF